MATSFLVPPPAAAIVSVSALPRAAVGVDLKDPEAEVALQSAPAAEASLQTPPSAEVTLALD